MPADTFLDTLDIECDTLSVIADSETLGGPTDEILPHLAVTPRRGVMSLRVAVLSNPFVELTIGVDLGGRILGLRDRRTGVEIIPVPSELRIVPEGPRGAHLRHGIEILAGGLYRSNALGPVEVQLREPNEEDEPAEVLIHELIPGQPASWQARWTLAPDSAQILFEFSMIRRDLDLDRNLEGCLSGLHFHGFSDFWVQSGGLVAALGNGNGLVVGCETGVFDGAWSERLLRRWCWQTALAPHQVDSWRLTLTPFSELTGIPVAGAHCAGTLSPTQLEFQTAKALEEAKVVVHLADGQVLESPLTATPEITTRMDLGSLPAAIQAAVILDRGKQQLLRMEAGAAPVELIGELVGLTENHPRLVSREGSRRNGALVLLAIEAIAEREWAVADRFLEEALLVQGDDWLTWWLRAAVRRNAGLDLEESNDLLNAHFLAPLEPMLRAEGFLRLPSEMGKEPSPLLKPLANHPDAQSELVCMLMQCALWGDAARLADEFLRHGNHGMVRYLLAWSLLTRTNLKAEAAEHVRQAESLPIASPYPWRPFEAKVASELLEAFPQSARLSQLHQRLRKRT